MCSIISINRPRAYRTFIILLSHVSLYALRLVQVQNHPRELSTGALCDWLCWSTETKLSDNFISNTVSIMVHSVYNLIFSWRTDWHTWFFSITISEWLSVMRMVHLWSLETWVFGLCAMTPGFLYYQPSAESFHNLRQLLI